MSVCMHVDGINCPHCGSLTDNTPPPAPPRLTEAWQQTQWSEEQLRRIVREEIRALLAVLE